MIVSHIVDPVDRKINRATYWIGIDDTDSTEGMCTTWLGACLIERIHKAGFLVLESRLIRLNPTIPFKTRGNAAVAIRFTGDPVVVCEIALSLVEKYADFSCLNTNPGIVICENQPPESFYLKALTSICTIEETEEILKDYGLFWKGYKNRRGLIGATAAVASVLLDYTWEFLIYRDLSRLGTLRDIHTDSVIRSQQVTWPHTWDTYDPADETVVSVPHGPDPVLIGIRGDSPFMIAKANTLLDGESPGLAWIWKTNQGTDTHLLNGVIGSLQEYHSYRVSGIVCFPPVTNAGGHVNLVICENEEQLSCMAFEPTKEFRQIIRHLVPGDEVLAVGSYLRETLNLEKICIRHLVDVVVEKPPVCACGKRMTSAGFRKGYKCRRCGSRGMESEISFLNRDISEGWYEVPPIARRHLSRPLIRDIVKGDG